jgi:Sulfite exporter TauE/SafE.
MTPVLIFFFGVKPHLAIGTDLLFAAFTKMGGTVSMARQRLVPGAWWACCARAAYRLHWLRCGCCTAWGQPRQAQHLMTSTLGIALLLTAAATAYKVLAFSPQRQAAEVAARRANAANAAEPRHWSLPVLLGAVIGMLVTFTSVGAGAIGVTVLLLVFPHLPLPRIIAPILPTPCR